MFNRIRNCFRFVCPRDWDNLQPTDAHNVRFCPSCTEHVYLVETDADFIAHARAGPPIKLWWMQLAYGYDQTMICLMRDNYTVTNV